MSRSCVVGILPWLQVGFVLIGFLQQHLCGASFVENSVQLQAEYRHPWVDLSCEVENIDRTVYLYCPHVSGAIPRPCFQDCNPLCDETVCPEMRRIGCKQNRANGKRTITFTVSNRNPHNGGKWYCQFGTEKSIKFVLSIEKPPTTTLKPTKKPVIVIPKKPAKPPKKAGSGHIGGKDDGVITVREHPQPTYPIIEEEKEKRRLKHGAFWSELTSPHLVMVVLALLGTSLIVNVAFCIRCILVKKYIDKYRRGVTDTSCLERCLCLPKARIRAGYKEDLYEDISSTPRAVYSPGGSAKSSGVDREDSLEFQSLARSRAYSPSSHRSQNPAARVGDIYATVVRGPRRGSAGGRYYSPQPPPASQQRVYDDVPESRSLSDIYARPQRQRPTLAAVISGGAGVGGSGCGSGGGASNSSATGSSPRHSPDSTGTSSNTALKRLSEEPVEEEAEMEREQEGELIEACTRNNTRLELSKTLLHRADTLLREAGVLLD